VVAFRGRERVPPAIGGAMKSWGHFEIAPRPLMQKGRNSPRFLKRALIYKGKPSDFDSAISPHQFRTRNDRNETQQTRSNVANREENQRRRSLSGRS
jgi:hypothetical protein